MKTITKSQLKALIEQAVAAQIPLGSKANRPQPDDIYVAMDDTHPTFFKVIEPTKSSKYGVIYKLAKIAARAERGVFTPDANAELGSRFHRTYHTGQKAFEIGSDVGVATKWDGRPVKAPGYFREQREEYPYQGNRSSDSVQKKEYDGHSGFHSKEAEDAYWAERELEEQAQHRWNKTRKMDADLFSSLSREDRGVIKCPKCLGTGELPPRDDVCAYCDGNGEVPRPPIAENKLTKSQLQRMIQRIVKEQVHGGDFAAWGDDEEVPAPAARPETSAPAPSEVSTSKMPKVGDIFVSNWGYDQTNIDFYKIVAVSKSGGPGVKVVKLGKVYLKQKPGQDYQVPVMPDKDNERSGAVAKRITKNGSIKISDYAWAYPWDGKEEFETASGYGH